MIRLLVTLFLLYSACIGMAQTKLVPSIGVLDSNATEDQMRWQKILAEEQARVSYTLAGFESGARVQHRLSYDASGKIVYHKSELVWNARTGGCFRIFSTKGELLAKRCFSGHVGNDGAVEYNFYTKENKADDHASNASNESHILEMSEGEYVLLDRDFRKIRDLNYSYVSYMTEDDVFRITVGEYPNETYGYINGKGKQIVKPKYDEADDFMEGVAIVGIDGEYGVINVSGKKIIPLSYSGIMYYRDVLRAEKDGVISFFDYKGRKTEVSIPKPQQNVGSTAKNEGGEDPRVREELNKMGYYRVSAGDTPPKNFNDYVAWKEARKKFGIMREKDRTHVPDKYEGAWPFAQGLTKVQLNDRFGLIDSTGAIVVPVRYHAISKLNRKTYYTADIPAGIIVASPSRFKDEYDAHWVLLNRDGSAISRKRFKEPGYYGEGLIRVKSGGKYGVIDSNAKVVIPIKYKAIQKYSDQLYSVKHKDEKFLINLKGKKVSRQKFDKIGYLKSLSRSQKDGLWGWLDSTGTVVIPFEYIEAYDFREGMCTVKKDNKWGAIDQTGRAIIPFEYDHLGTCIRGRIHAKQKGKMGVLDSLGTVVVPFKYDHIGSYNHLGFADIIVDKKKGFIYLNGKEMIPPDYSYVKAAGRNTRNELIFVVAKDKKYGLIDSINTSIVEPQYQALKPFGYSSQHIWAVVDHKYGIIDLEGKIVRPMEYDSHSSFSNRSGNYSCRLTKIRRDSIVDLFIKMDNSEVERRARFNTNFGFKKVYVEVIGKSRRPVKYGWVNWEGDTIVKPQYDIVRNFQSYWSAAVRENKHGLLDTTGRELTDFIYDDFAYLDKDLFKMKVGQDWGIFNPVLNYASEVKYSQIHSFHDGLAAVKTAGDQPLYGFIDEDGKEAIIPQYDHVWPFRDGYAPVSFQRKIGLINEDGSYLLPPGNYGTPKGAIKYYKRSKE